jgi:hypothetical protein
MRKPSPTMIVAAAALVLSLGGTAIAASHYIITSTDQIKPSVLRRLGGPRAETSVAKTPKGPKAVIARIRSSESFTISEDASVNVPLTGNTWTQAAGQVNALIGAVSITPPSETCGGLSTNVEVDGLQAAGNLGVTNASAHPIEWWTSLGGSSKPQADLWLMEPTVATSHTLTMHMTYACHFESPVGSYKINSVAIDVIGLR